MSPAAKEIEMAAPYTRYAEEKLLVAVVAGKLSAKCAAESLTPSYLDRNDSGVRKMKQAAIEDFEFYRDMVRAEHHHDKDMLLDTARSLRKLWGREE